MRELNGENKVVAKSAPKRAKIQKVIVEDQEEIIESIMNTPDIYDREGIFSLTRDEVDAIALLEEAEKLAEILECVDSSFNFDKTLETLTTLDFSDYKKVSDCKFMIPAQLLPYWDEVKGIEGLKGLLEYKMFQSDFDVELLHAVKREFIK